MVGLDKIFEIQSLKYPGYNEIHNYILYSHKQSFEIYQYVYYYDRMKVNLILFELQRSRLLRFVNILSTSAHHDPHA